MLCLRIEEGFYNCNKVHTCLFPFYQLCSRKCRSISAPGWWSYIPPPTMAYRNTVSPILPDKCSVLLSQYRNLASCAIVISFPSVQFKQAKALIPKFILGSCSIFMGLFAMRYSLYNAFPRTMWRQQYSLKALMDFSRGSLLIRKRGQLWFSSFLTTYWVKLLIQANFNLLSFGVNT